MNQANDPDPITGPRFFPPRDTASPSRRQLLLGALGSLGLTAVPWAVPAGRHHVDATTLHYGRHVDMVTAYSAKNPQKLLKLLPGRPGYHPTIASIDANLRQVGAPKSTQTDLYGRALEYITRDWFRWHLGSTTSANPLPQLIRKTGFGWLDYHPTGFSPRYPVHRLLLERETPKARKQFNTRAKLQVQRLYKAMCGRLPSTPLRPLRGVTPNNNELGDGMRLLIGRTFTQLPSALPQPIMGQRQPWLEIAKAYAEADPTPTSTPFGSNLGMNEGDYFPDPPNFTDETTTEVAIELAFASAAAAETAAVMGEAAAVLFSAAIEGIGAGGGTIGALSAFGLSALLGFTAAILGGAAVAFFLVLVTAKKQPDGRWNFYVEFAPMSFGFPGCSGCSGTFGGTLSIGMTPSITPATNQVEMTLGLSRGSDPVDPMGNFTGDDAGPAPSDSGAVGDAGDSE